MNKKQYDALQMFYGIICKMGKDCEAQWCESRKEIKEAFAEDYKEFHLKEVNQNQE